ncbi:hypothetical protein F511_01998 [Dorcoceras hygrometricum]|uniref:Uncharacterized protein n=1 Tax=Dorcoceras hygrometricum TaxID=472368 RepID=A0A2Z7AA40_9LAMI|nr:hypothetical protein F511_01998 [Dorcoceras hygrometricum]
MASSYYTNTLHVNFETVLAMDDPGMVSMFQALMASGLEGFLGCPVVIYEAALVDLRMFQSEMVWLSVQCMGLQWMFAETFELQLEGLSELSEIPKDLVFDTRSIVSLSGEPVSTSGKKKEMKTEFRLLCDNLAKKISVKAGSFDARSMEKFLMLTVIICEVKINWNRVLFNILKDMVIAGSRQEKGYAIQISLLLENIQNLELGESSEFPSSKILTEKTVHRYVVLNDKVGLEEAADAPKVTRAPKKKAASKKRPAVVPVAAPIVKKKRKTKKKYGSLKENLEIVAVAQEAIPIQIIEPIFATPVRNQLMWRQLLKSFDEPAVEGTTEEIRPPSTDDVDDIIEQVLAETAHIEADEEDHGVGTSDVGDQPAGIADDSVPWFNLPYEVLIARDSERVFETASDTEDEEMETINIGDQQLQTVDTTDSRADAAADYFVEKTVEETETEADELSADEAMSMEDFLLTIPVDVPLPSSSMEITKITLGQCIKIPGVDERTWYLANLPKIKPEDKGKKPLQEKDPVKGHPVKEEILLILADIECLEELVLSWGEAESTRVALNRRMYILTKYRELLIRKFLEARKINFAPGDGTSAVDLQVLDRLSDIHSFVLEELKEQTRAHGLMWKKTCCLKIFEGRPRDNDGRTLDDVQILRFNEFRKGFLAHSAAVTADSMDFRKEFRALNAKVTSLDEQVAATRNDLLEFSAQAQENLNRIIDQLSKLIAYINRGGNDKKGEVSSSRPQPPPDDQNRGSGNTCGGSVARTTDIVDRLVLLDKSGDEVFRRCNQPLRHKGRYFKRSAGAYFQELKLSAGAYFQKFKSSAGVKTMN